MRVFTYLFHFLLRTREFLSPFYSKVQRILFFIEYRILPVLFPRHCPLCDRLLPYGTLIHLECHQKLPFVQGAVCLRCGKPISSSTQEYCYDCRIFPKSFRRGFALFLYDKKTRPVMSAFKYQNKRSFADFFIWELLLKHRSQIESLGINAVIPVPIHKNKYKKRGYNQAELLSSRLAMILNLSYYPDMLIRCADTLPQKQFSPQARLTNLTKAFCFNSRYATLLKNTSVSILLVDDIYTSGATMEACTRILLNAGVTNVYILSICIGVARD